MKTAYVTIYDSSDLHAWSGTGHYIRHALQQQGFQIDQIGNLRDVYGFISKTKKFFYTNALHKTYLRDREPLTLKSYAAQVENMLATRDCDLVFSTGTLPIAHLNTNKPMMFWSDATFAGMIDFYSAFSDLCSE